MDSEGSEGAALGGAGRHRSHDAASGVEMFLADDAVTVVVQGPLVRSSIGTLRAALELGISHHREVRLDLPVAALAGGPTLRVLWIAGRRAAAVVRRRARPGPPPRSRGLLSSGDGPAVPPAVEPRLPTLPLPRTARKEDGS